MAQFVGKVIGTQIIKTAKVEVTRMVLHPHVLQVSETSRELIRQSLPCKFSSQLYVKRRKKYLCYDPKSSCRVGDLVMIRECQPLSKRKHSSILEFSSAHRAEVELEKRKQRELDDAACTAVAEDGSCS